MTRLRKLTGGVTAAIAAGAICAGCSNSQPPPMAAAIPPLTEPQPVDGTYDGMMQLIRGDVGTCGNTNEFHLKVVDHRFSYQLAQPQADWRPVLSFTATIGQDGAFEGNAGSGFIRGTLKDGHMHGRISGDICGFTFDADRSGSW